MGAELAGQRKRLARLKDAVDALAAKFAEQDGRERRRFEELTLECGRLRKQYKDLQRRFRHFVCADRERYDKVSERAAWVGWMGWVGGDTKDMNNHAD
jgi:dynein regulatry complex protein 1